MLIEVHKESDAFAEDEIGRADDFVGGDEIPVSIVESHAHFDRRGMGAEIADDNEAAVSLIISEVHAERSDFGGPILEELNVLEFVGGEGRVVAAHDGEVIGGDGGVVGVDHVPVAVIGFDDGGLAEAIAVGGGGRRIEDGKTTMEAGEGPSAVVGGGHHDEAGIRETGAVAILGVTGVGKVKGVAIAVDVGVAGVFTVVGAVDACRSEGDAGDRIGEAFESGGLFVEDVIAGDGGVGKAAGPNFVESLDIIEDEGGAVVVAALFVGHDFVPFVVSAFELFFRF